MIFGGVSQEHDVSVLTGVFTLNCIDKSKYNAVPVYISKEGIWYTGEVMRDVSFFRSPDFKKLSRVTLVSGDDKLYYIKRNAFKKFCEPYCAINCLHGRNGEDGSLFSLLRLCKIPSASPDIFSSSASMDKSKTKVFLRGLGAKVADYKAIRSEDYFLRVNEVIDGLIEDLGLPLIVKPASSGSSIGIGVAKSKEELSACLNKAFRFDKICVVERFLKGAVDINCAAYERRGEVVASECEKPMTKGEFLTFADKYSTSKYGAGKEFPAKIEKAVSDEIKETTKEVYKAFGFNGVVRIDYLLYEGKVYLNEINSVPGSLAYYLFCDKIADFPKMLDELIEEGVKRFVSYENCLFDYASDVLSFKGVALKK